MIGLLAAVAWTLLGAVTAVGLAAPFSAIAGWYAATEARTAVGARACLRLLGALPIVVFGLVLVQLHGARLGSLGLVGAMALGAFGPLGLGVTEAREALGWRVERDALALGLRPLVVVTRVVLPEIGPRLAAVTLRVGARLIGEAGLFVVAAGELGRARALGLLVYPRPAAWPEPTLNWAIAGGLIVLMCLGLGAAAARVDRGGRT